MRRILCIIPLILVAASAAVQGQGAGPSRLSTPTTDRKKDLLEAAEKLKRAKETMDLEKAREAAEGVLQKLPPKMSDTAKDALESPETRGKILDAAKSAAGSLLPEAQKLMKNESATPAEDTPAAVPSAPPSGPIPAPLQPMATTSSLTGKNSVIIESDDSTFDLKSAIFIYTGHVRVRHPQFYIECEELEVHMAKEEEALEKKPVLKRDPLSPEGGKKAPDSRIKMAVARGPMVTIEKLTETGDVQQGKCKQAVYRGATGEIVMSNYPQVQRGNMLHIATDPSTEMTFDPNGKLHTSGGRQRTIVVPTEAGQGATPVDAFPKSKPNAP